MSVVFDTTKLFHPELRELLGGETPLVAVSCQVAFGADRLERSPAEIEHTLRFLPPGVRQQALELLRTPPAQRDEQAWQKLLDRTVFDALSGDLVTGDPDRLLGGVTASGQAGSWAHRLSRVLERTTMGHCVVSPTRIVFADHNVKGPFTELAALPRTAVVHARRAGRLLQRGRVVLDFADLSQLALMTGMVSAHNANRLVAALRTAR